MVIQELVRQHPHLFHTLSALAGSSVSSVSLGFASIPLYQRLFEFTLSEAVYMSSMTFYLIFLFVFTSSFVKRGPKAIWLFNLQLCVFALLINIGLT